jgi:glycosyltransferase involved in cell wall biosynthesis
MKELITCCLIVKNEEKNIERCLKSIKQISSQIVIVDTGSTDNTLKLASRFNPEIYFHNWNNDFSEARNYSLSYALNEWILVIDADEELEHFGVKEEILLDEKIGGISCLIRNNMDKEGLTESKHTYTRFFRNSPTIRFSGKIHEQIRESIESNNFTINEEQEIVLRHYGYIETSIEKKLRNKEILVSVDLDDDFNKLNLADTEFSLDNNDTAKKLYLEIKDSKNLSKEQLEKIKIRLGQISLKQNEFKDVLYYTDFISEDVDTEGLKNFVRAAAFLSIGEFQKAKLLYNSQDILKSKLVDKDIVLKGIELIEKLNKIN